MFRRLPETPRFSETPRAVDEERGLELVAAKIGLEGDTIFHLRFRDEEIIFVATYEPSTQDGHEVAGWTVSPLPLNAAETARKFGVDDVQQVVEQALRTFASFGREPARVSHVTFRSGRTSR